MRGIFFFLGCSYNLENLICSAHLVPSLPTVMAREAMGDPRSFSRSHRERYERFMEDSCCMHFCIGPNPYMARYLYGLFFPVTGLLAWTIRDYGHDALSELNSKLLVLILVSSQLLSVSCNIFRTQRMPWHSLLFRD